MKPIEEGAKEYSISSYPNVLDMQFACEMHFEAGAEWMRKELTRWHDPKEELPEIKRTIAVKLRSDKGYNLQTGRYEGNEWRFTLNNHTIPATLIFGWREIHE